MTTKPMLPAVARRFLHYVQIDTQSDPDSTSTPSTIKQKDLGRLLVKELQELGIEDASMDDFGYVFGTIASNQSQDLPVLALLAHMDTSFDESGASVNPQIHYHYQGETIALPGNPEVKLDPDRDPALLAHIGHDLITSDGTTLLGSDDKAGIAVIMQCAADLLNDPTLPRPPLRLCFTIDEEIGRGVDKLDLNVLGADVAYTLDGDATGTLSAETFNAVEVSVTVQGLMVHPGYAKDLMVNGIRILSELIASLPSDEAPETTEGREGYFHPHHITSGEVQRAGVKILLRDFTIEGLQRRKRIITKRVEQLRNKYPGAGIQLEIKDQYRNMLSYIEEKDIRTVTFAQQAANDMGIDLELKSIRGGTDGARLSEMGLPTPNIFTGGHQFHSCFEWNTVQNLELSLAYLKTLVRYWAEHGHEDA